MLFTQPVFFAFFAVVLLLQWQLLRSSRSRKWMLLAASYLFYGWWDWRFLSLIIVSTMIDYTAALRIQASDDPALRRRWMLLSLASNLGMLGFFKYAGFFADSAVALANSLGGELSSTTLNVVLPVGISFFTFQTLSYTIDVYRGSLQARSDLLDVAVFVAFFPQLVAGPIVRASHFLPQLESPRLLSSVEWRAAVTLFFVGFFKKAVISDTIGTEVDKVFSDPSGFDALSTVLAVFGYAAQIYGDFSGYSDMAIAVAMMLGYSLGENFNFPYLSRSIDDFWRRWHISLSSWLRDYLYISLGGNRQGPWMTYRNLMLTMVLGGLWHGAGWNFVIWGALHGGALALTRWLRDDRPAPERVMTASTLRAIVSTLATFLFVCVCWIFFRAASFGDAWTVLTNFVLLDGDGPGQISRWVAVYLVAAAILHVASWRRTIAPLVERVPEPQYAAALGVSAAVVLALRPLGSSPFIYFQF